MINHRGEVLTVNAPVKLVDTDTAARTAGREREQDTMTELTIRPEEIRDAIERNVAAYSPTTAG